jgi:protein tyrosine phosphatase (PTP) superfamily phosphohydrolase (DUF442 family)
MNNLSSKLENILKKANQVFDEAGAEFEINPVDSLFGSDDSDYYWKKIPESARNLSREIQKELMDLGRQVFHATNQSTLTSEADIKDVKLCIKKMKYSIHFRKYYHQDTDIIHNEGEFLGFSPESQSSDQMSDLNDSKSNFYAAHRELQNIIDFIDPDISLDQNQNKERDYPPNTAKYKKNTAFIMMSMDNDQPGLDDIKDAIKEVFLKFDIKAVRADDIEHEDVISKKVLNEIRTSEFLFADLTGARPNVYYEVGFAHALGRRVILYREKGSGLHFDLADYNCPEYENLRELKEKLTKRLEAVTGKSIDRDRTPHH